MDLSAELCWCSWLRLSKTRTRDGTMPVERANVDHFKVETAARRDLLTCASAPRAERPPKLNQQFRQIFRERSFAFATFQQILFGFLQKENLKRVNRNPFLAAGEKKLVLTFAGLRQKRNRYWNDKPKFTPQWCWSVTTLWRSTQLGIQKVFFSLNVAYFGKFQACRIS